MGEVREEDEEGEVRGILWKTTGARWSVGKVIETVVSEDEAGVACSSPRGATLGFFLRTGGGF
jgi:hypothetical protein